MINLKLDLYKTGWLDLVFANRNQAYGAYYLRKHNAENTAKAMAITFITVVAAVLALSLALRVKPRAIITATPIDLTHYVKPPEPPKKEDVHSSKASAPKQVTTTRVAIPVVVPQDPPTEPTKLIDIKGEIGPETIDIPEGTVGAPTIDEPTGKGGKGNAVASEEDKTVYVNGVDVEPEPIGGAAAWAKFLQKNLKYPHAAIEQGISGKVFVSFIVEKDGHISTLEIARGVGYGLDEEALRVLKMALPWKPGKQHGNPVRVKYTLPLNFTLDQQ